MKFDRQTLVWLNDKKWFDKILLKGGGIGENAGLPSSNMPTWIFRIDKDGNHIREFYGWGHEKWHHSVNLKYNLCKCERCQGISDNWEFKFVPLVNR